MLLGIDVGGTFTDAVLLDTENLIAQAKVKTNHQNVLQCLLSALDKVLPKDEKTLLKIQRVVISSTLVTNALTENILEPVLLAVIAGPGMNITEHLPAKALFLDGYVNHRGKIIKPITWPKNFIIDDNLQKKVCAISGKFAVRNPQLELLLESKLNTIGYQKAFLGSELSGELNFIRRTNSAYFSAQVYDLFNKFSKQITKAVRKRGVKAPIYVLKADGGTLPLKEALKQPVEAVFTGPAASVLGIAALSAPQTNSISLDVGGTTTDIAFWENGLPLLSKKGAVINGYPTAVHSFFMRSVGIGGDSLVKKVDGKYQVGPMRKGPAVAVGGKEATLSDALITAGYVNFGNKILAQKAIKTFGDDIVEEAKKIVAVAIHTIIKVIEEMLATWEKQPVYTVKDVICGTKFEPKQLIGVGGGALGLVKALGEVMQLPVNIPKGGVVANAVGAAVAKPTLSAGLRADTTEGYYIIPESGKREKLPAKFNRQIAEAILSSWIQQQAQEWLLTDGQMEVIRYEHFYTVHNYYDTGDIYNLRMQLKPGILCTIQGKEVDFNG